MNTTSIPQNPAFINPVVDFRLASQSCFAIAGLPKIHYRVNPSPGSLQNKLYPLSIENDRQKLFPKEGIAVSRKALYVIVENSLLGIIPQLSDSEREKKSLKRNLSTVLEDLTRLQIPVVFATTSDDKETKILENAPACAYAVITGSMFESGFLLDMQKFVLRHLALTCHDASRAARMKRGDDSPEIIYIIRGTVSQGSTWRLQSIPEHVRRLVFFKRARCRHVADVEGLLAVLREISKEQKALAGWR